MKFIFKLYVLLAVLFCAGPLTAQNTGEGVRFIDKSLDELLAQARTENKLVFIDCYTTYCPPCKLMLNKEFPKKEMGDYLNAGFVCAKMNLALGEGPELARKWDVHAFPTFLFLDSEGNILYRMTGYMAADKFIAAAKAGLADNTFRNIEERYRQGDRSRDLVVAYIQGLQKMKRKQAHKEVVSEFLADRRTDLLTDTLAFGWFCRYIDSPYDPAFRKVYDNRAAFEKRYGERCIAKLQEVWWEYPRMFSRFEGNRFLGYDREKLETYREYMTRHGVNAEPILCDVYLGEASYAGDWTKLWQIVDRYYTMPEAREASLSYAFTVLADSLTARADLEKLAGMIRYRQEHFNAGDSRFGPELIAETYRKLADKVKEKIAAAPCCLKGRIEGYRGGKVLLYVGNREDSIPMNADGSFNHCFRLDLPAAAFFTSQEHRGSFGLFVEPGMTADLQIAFHEEEFMGEPMAVAEVEYAGDNADCFRFMQDFEKWKRDAWPFERMDTLTFAQFRELLLEDLDLLHSRLIQVKNPVFRAMMNQQIGSDPTPRLLRFAWSKPRHDAQFDIWMETFDRNNPANFAFAFDYLRWYDRVNLPVSGTNRHVQHFDNMKKVFTNQQVIDALARDYIQKYLARPGSDIDEVWQAFCRICPDTATRTKLQAKYEYAARFTPGRPAPDFEMTGFDGKVYRLSDFRGKNLYIDIWATWCGPCCHEIPYMEKLAKHYRKNRNIELISISLDKDLQAWKRKLKEDKPQWKQFICPENFQSALVREYGIKGIPRFLFIDKKGKIITVDAPRPSHERIIEYLNGKIN